jgi:Fe-S cluster assembly protein SufD
MLQGIHFGLEDQHIAMETLQDHQAVHTTSDLLYKGALHGKARSVYEGLIRVRPGAQKANAYQANRNLILSPNARADSIPSLEIEADDVRCTHGATVGMIEPEYIFYMESRGIPRPEAVRLIAEGFYVPVFDRITDERARTAFADRLWEKMAKCTL